MNRLEAIKKRAGLILSMKAIPLMYMEGLPLETMVDQFLAVVDAAVKLAYEDAFWDEDANEYIVPVETIDKLRAALAPLLEATE